MKKLLIALTLIAFVALGTVIHAGDTPWSTTQSTATTNSVYVGTKGFSGTTRVVPQSVKLSAITVDYNGTVGGGTNKTFKVTLTRGGVVSTLLSVATTNTAYNATATSARVLIADDILTSAVSSTGGLTPIATIFTFDYVY